MDNTLIPTGTRVYVYLENKLEYLGELYEIYYLECSHMHDVLILKDDGYFTTTPLTFLRYDREQNILTEEKPK